MPPHKKAREQATRQVNVAKQVLDPEVLTKRTKRHLEELERTNYSASVTLNDPDSEPESSTNSKSKFRARQMVISDKRTFGNSKPKKKSSMNVRTAVLYRKGLAALVDESGISTLPSTVPSYLTATAPPSPYPVRLLCSVCGYKGAYKCKKCAMPYCDMNCGQVHDETRCERRVI
ncbi:hypothetical protein F5J12DRAFT_715391 [Pisolithus orientalis]|uniref:uncharacterized protein n=1 Tax=Pisolithus orientalis TaxID=936130 RepID=UPI0022248C26|nr:uncharacterized protein F5J12DRAFT_715391 [Pisolithus orientalis]KAI6025598.1 hypothetical protein F5J12DRAFT_715391 [Pisolithus orientalis]